MNCRSLLIALITTAGVAACDSSDPVAATPACALDFRLIGVVNGRAIEADTVMMAEPGSQFRIVPQASSLTCADDRIEYVSRNPQIAEVGSPNGYERTITAREPGTTTILVQPLGDPAARDSFVVVVLRGLELLILEGGGQTDTIDAVFRDSLVVLVRERETHRPVKGALVSGHTPGFVFSNEMTPYEFRDTTDVRGRVVVELRGGGVAGRHPIYVNAFCVVCAAATSTLRDSTHVNVLPGNPHTVGLLESFPVNNRIYSTIAGRQIEIGVYLFDRDRNPLGRTTGTFEVLSGTAIDLTGEGRITKSEFGESAFRVTTPYGQLRGTIRVFPGLQVAGSTGISFGELNTMYLDGSNRRDIGEIVVAAGESPVDWSPAANAMVFDGVYPGMATTRHVFIGYLDGSSEPLLPAFRDSAEDFGARFSPDGGHVYFSKRNASGSAELWRTRLSDRLTERITVASALHTDRSPAASPDGSRVAFIRAPSTSLGGDVLIVDLSTGQLRDSGLDALYVEWSPVDDRFIVVTLPSGATSEMLLVDANGTIIRRLDAITLTSPVNRGGRGWFDWSRDGQYIITDFAVIDVNTGARVEPGQHLSRRGWAPR